MRTLQAPRWHRERKAQDLQFSARPAEAAHAALRAEIRSLPGLAPSTSMG